jgi:adenine phosphoribosyltransferase
MRNCEKLFPAKVFLISQIMDSKSCSEEIAALMPVLPSARVGVEFRSMARLLASPVHKAKAWAQLYEAAASLNPTCIVGIDSRGYIMGEAIATHLGLKFIMCAKSGKLPGDVIKAQAYETEYNKQESLEITQHVIDFTDRVIIVDDILATGGSALNAGDVVSQTGANIVGFLFLGSIASLNGKDRIMKKFPETCVFSVCEFGKSRDEESKCTKIQDLVFDSTNRVVLLYHPKRKQHAEEMFLRCPGKFELQPIAWERFNDGWPNIKLLQPERLNNRKVVFLMACEDLGHVLEQLFVCMILPAQFLKSLVIDINYFAPGTHERVTQPGVLATAETMSRLFTTIPHTKTGPPIIQIMDLHALPNQFYFANCFTHLISSLEMLMREKPHATIVCPDDGAYKRLGPALMAKNYPILICSKIRENDKRSVKVSEWKNFPSHYSECKALLNEVIIVDDLCHSGSTLAECAQELKKIEGVVHIDAWITHGVFEQSHYLKFLRGGKHSGLFRTIHITDSIAGTASTIQHHPRNDTFQIHPISETVARQALKLVEVAADCHVPFLYVDYSGISYDILHPMLEKLFQEISWFVPGWRWSIQGVTFSDESDLNVATQKSNRGDLYVAIMGKADKFYIGTKWIFGTNQKLAPRFRYATSANLKRQIEALVFTA